MIAFTQPLFLWGLLLVGVPVWIHFKGIRQNKAVSIPSLMWLQNVTPSDARKNRLKDLIVLILRMLFVFFIVITLANPERKSKNFDLQIDNYPSSWNTNEQWLLPMLNSLADGTYNVYDREGIFLGSYSKDAIPALIRRLNPTTKEIHNIINAKLLSFGFADIGQSTEVLLPNRKVLKNRRISLVSNGISEWKIDLDTIVPVRVIRKGTIIEQAKDSIYAIQHSMGSLNDTIRFESDLDDIHEDNNILFFPSIGGRTAIILSENTPLPSGQFVGDALITYQSGIDIDLTKYKAVVLIGFDYTPAIFKDYKGKLAKFKSNLSNSVKGSSIPQVSQEFFQTYFIGPSLNNRWPIFYDGQHLGPGKSKALLIDFDGNSLANIDGNRYEQAFTPSNWDHPFYEALWQWLEGTTTQTRYTPFLGEDQYTKNAQAKGVAISGGKNMEESGVTTSVLATSRLSLVLALFCAVLALIFVKI